MSYKDDQKMPNVAFIVHDSFAMGTLDLGIKQFKKLGKTKKEIREFKKWTWSSK